MRIIALGFLSFFIITSSHGASLTEEKVVASVKHNFPLILAQKALIDEAKATFLSRQGTFDQKLVGTSYAQPQGGYERQYFDVALENPIENTALKLYAGYRIGRGDWPIYYQNDLTNRYGETRLGLSLPLLRDYEIDKPRLEIYKSLLGIEIQKIKTDLTQIQVIEQARNSYWDWIRYAKLVAINEELLKTAITRQDAIIKHVELGDLERIKITENEQQIFNRQNILQAAKKKYQQAVNNLSLYYRDREGTPILVTKNNIPILDYNLNNYQLAASKISYLYANHPELRLINLHKKQIKLVLKQAFNEFKPKFDLKLYTEEDHGEGSSKLAQRSYNIAINYEFPLQQRTARGKIKAAQNKLKALESNQYYLKNKLIIDIREELLSLSLKKEGFLLEQKQVNATTKVLHAEIEKFNSGSSSLFLVNQREQLLGSEQQEAVNLFIDYHKLKNSLEALCFYKTNCIKQLYQPI